MSKLHPNHAPERSLVDEWNDTADEFRQLATDLGARPYRVFAVVVRHSGGTDGRGDPVVVQETELLPTPLVKSRGQRQDLKSAGKTERGHIELTEVSPRYTEDQLQQMFHVKPLLDGLEGFYEVRIDRRDGRAPRRRRYTLRGVPELDAENFQWVLKLQKQDGNRARDGEPAKVRRVWRR